jgi:hypothetical protein
VLGRGRHGGQPCSLATSTRTHLYRYKSSSLLMSIHRVGATIAASGVEQEGPVQPAPGRRLRLRSARKLPAPHPALRHTGDPPRRCPDLHCGRADQDQVHELRGMAIKVLGVHGLKVLPGDDGVTQDFLLDENVVVGSDEQHDGLGRRHPNCRRGRGISNSTRTRPPVDRCASLRMTMIASLGLTTIRM